MAGGAFVMALSPTSYTLTGVCTVLMRAAVQHHRDLNNPFFMTSCPALLKTAKGCSPGAEGA